MLRRSVTAPEKIAAAQTQWNADEVEIVEQEAAIRCRIDRYFSKMKPLFAVIKAWADANLPADAVVARAAGPVAAIPNPPYPVRDVEVVLRPCHLCGAQHCHHWLCSVLLAEHYEKTIAHAKRAGRAPDVVCLEEANGHLPNSPGRSHWMQLAIAFRTGKTGAAIDP